MMTMISRSRRPVPAGAWGVAATAQWSLPDLMFALLMITGVIAAIVVGIETAVSNRPILTFVWCVIPALSITVVIALAYPFAHSLGVNLAPLQAVAEDLSAR